VLLVYSFLFFFFFSSRRRHTRFSRDWSSDVCSSDLNGSERRPALHTALRRPLGDRVLVNGVDVMPQVHSALLRMSELVGRVHHEIGRASCRERVEISVGAATIKKKEQQKEQSMMQGK